MVVREQVFGSVINAYGSVYVGKQLGNKAAISTKVYLGYHPASIRQLEKIDAIIATQSQAHTHLKAVVGHLPPDAGEASSKLAGLTLRREQLMKRRTNCGPSFIWMKTTCRTAASWCPARFFRVWKFLSAGRLCWLSGRMKMCFSA